MAKFATHYNFPPFKMFPPSGDLMIDTQDCFFCFSGYDSRGIFFPAHSIPVKPTPTGYIFNVEAMLYDKAFSVSEIGGVKFHHLASRPLSLVDSLRLPSSQFNMSASVYRTSLPTLRKVGPPPRTRQACIALIVTRKNSAASFSVFNVSCSFIVTSHW